MLLHYCFQTWRAACCIEGVFVFKNGISHEISTSGFNKYDYYLSPLLNVNVNVLFDSSVESVDIQSKYTEDIDKPLHIRKTFVKQKL